MREEIAIEFEQWVVALKGRGVHRKVLESKTDRVFMAEREGKLCLSWFPGVTMNKAWQIF